MDKVIFKAILEVVLKTTLKIIIMSDSTFSENPGGGSPISKDQATKMINEYKKLRLPLIKEAYKIDDTRSVWFKKEVFEEMLRANPNMDGIRIYFGVNYEGDLKGHQSVVLIGTNREEVEGSVSTQSTEDEDNIFDTGTMCPPNC
ncbi:hypothetical protein JKA74_06895 [Marivirga sp. S37H4]|uniref:Uncharacterized protein n=1 Tax=Marivirga aurantiaca TaxID=2802615 RepID=A0A934WX67_9BACT|nr:hypothetical protein [Marivirga aurantiaca]MBK6264758.1 hypothetical protein [Marivirga aurantiaca]